MAQRERVVSSKSAEAPDGLEELKAALRFSKNDLDTALIEQPAIFYKVSEQLALAISRRDYLKNDLERLKAELDNWYRKDAKKNEEKLTEVQLANRILLDKEYDKMYRDFLDASALASRWQAMKEAFQQRSYVLKDMVSLYTANYFSDHVGGSARRDASDRQHEQTRERMAEQRRARSGD